MPGLRKEWKWGLWLALPVFALALYWFGFDREPRHGGKTLSYWTERLYEHSRVDRGIVFYGTPGYLENIEAIQAIGPAAVPHVLRLLCAEDTELRRLARFIVKLTPLKVNLRTAQERRMEGFHAMRALGSSASNAVPGLIAMLDSSNLQQQRFALMALSMVGPRAAEALPVVTDFLEDPNLSIGAFSVVDRLGTNAQEALPLIVKILSDSSDDSCRTFAAHTLRNYGSSGLVGLPELIRATHADDKRLVTEARLTIMHLAERVEPFKEALLEVIDGPDLELAEQARLLYTNYFPGTPVESYSPFTDLIP